MRGGTLGDAQLQGVEAQGLLVEPSIELLHLVEEQLEIGIHGSTRALETGIVGWEEWEGFQDGENESLIPIVNTSRRGKGIGSRRCWRKEKNRKGSDTNSEFSWSFSSLIRNPHTPPAYITHATRGQRTSYLAGPRAWALGRPWSLHILQYSCDHQDGPGQQ